jgi:hypothetical protein
VKGLRPEPLSRATTISRECRRQRIVDATIELHQTVGAGEQGLTDGQAADLMLRLTVRT